MTYKAIAALLIFLTSIIAVIYPLQTKRHHLQDQAASLELGEAFASGIFLGVAFFHMLPSSLTAFHELYPNIIYPIPEALCLLGFLLLLFLERLSLEKTLFNPQKTIPYLVATILIIHALTEGAALGIGNTFAQSFMIFIAIIAHKGSASFALCVTLLRYHLSFSRTVFLLIFFALMSPIGIGIGALINLFTHSEGGKLAAAMFNAFAAGTFLYISALHHIQFHQRMKDAQGLLEFACLTVGVIVMGVIAVVA